MIDLINKRIKILEEINKLDREFCKQLNEKNKKDKEVIEQSKANRSMLQYAIYELQALKKEMEDLENGK